MFGWDSLPPCRAGPWPVYNAMYCTLWPVGRQAPRRDPPSPCRTAPQSLYTTLCTFWPVGRQAPRWDPFSPCRTAPMVLYTTQCTGTLWPVGRQAPRWDSPLPAGKDLWRCTQPYVLWPVGRQAGTQVGFSPPCRTGPMALRTTLCTLWPVGRQAGTQVGFPPPCRTGPMALHTTLCTLWPVGRQAPRWDPPSPCRTAAPTAAPGTQVGNTCSTRSTAVPSSLSSCWKFYLLKLNYRKLIIKFKNIYVGKETTSDLLSPDRVTFSPFKKFLPYRL
jgi:hypothetical protein